MEREFQGRYEILIITNHDATDKADGTESLALELAGLFPCVRVTKHVGPAGKGAALKSGFLDSTGDWIFFVDSDLPYDLSFFLKASHWLSKGVDFVSGNRRMQGSEILCETRFVARFLRRLWLGRLFNRVLRWLLPLASTDTQAGIKAMNRRFASVAFGLQTCPGFYFDIELFLTCAAQGFRHFEVPLRSNVTTDVSTVRFFRELRRAAFWVSRVFWQNLRGHYAGNAAFSSWNQWNFTADDWGLSPGVNRGILALARKGILRRVSVMSDSAYLDEGLNELREIPGVSLGLHFNLTYRFGKPLPFAWASPASAFLGCVARVWGGQVEFQNTLKQELLRQIAALRAKGLSLQYIDGHHHIHVFPGISKVVADVCVEVGIREVRVPLDKSSMRFSHFFIGALTRLSRPHFKQASLTYLPFFYPPLNSFKNPLRLRRELLKRQGYEVLVHPSDSDDVANLPTPDAYSAQRVIEYRALLNLWDPQRT
jgi:predicted glycoside hydrolase/deacetylase ChbG (UPF0249 family)